MHRVTDLLTSNLTINDQLLHVQWDPVVADRALYATLSSPSTHLLTIPDERGLSHAVDISISGYILVDGSQQSFRKPDHLQHLSLLVRSVDASAVHHLQLDIVAQSTASDTRLRKLSRVSDMYPAGSAARKVELLSANSIPDANPFADQRNGVDLGDGGELDVELEIESLLHLEAQARQLSTQIAAKRLGISKHLRDHREHVSLGHMLRQCEGVLCAAKVIAQRVCDKMGVETEPTFTYVQTPDSSTQQLIPIDSEDTQDDVQHAPHTAAAAAAAAVPSSSRLSRNSLAGNGHFTLRTSGAAIRQSMEIVYPQSMLYRVLGVLFSAFGLTALCGFIRRKCMSARRMVDELAEREERRNARAYRRAARRADMRKRWDDFLRSVSCFSMRGEDPQVGSYEEKRALILQDAFLEQGVEAAEQGEVMEAQIRELRNAHEIVSSLVRVDEYRYDLAPLVMNNPLPPSPMPLVPLPRRSRSSTATLPSYTSELLPDYQSRISTVSTTIASSRTSSIDDSSEYTPTTSSAAEGEEDASATADTDSTPRPFSIEVSTGTRGSQLTDISSVIEISPRTSEETLRTFQRSSMGSQDTDL